MVEPPGHQCHKRTHKIMRQNFKRYHFFTAKKGRPRRFLNPAKGFPSHSQSFFALSLAPCGLSRTRAGVVSSRFKFVASNWDLLSTERLPRFIGNRRGSCPSSCTAGGRQCNCRQNWGYVTANPREPLPIGQSPVKSRNRINRLYGLA